MGHGWRTLELAIPKLPQGSYFSSWLEPRRRAEQALGAVVAEAYVQGVSTRKVEALVQSLGITGLSKSEVSRLCSVLDEQAEIFRTRPLDAIYPYIRRRTRPPSPHARCSRSGRSGRTSTRIRSQEAAVHALRGLMTSSPHAACRTLAWRRARSRGVAR